MLRAALLLVSNLASRNNLNHANRAELLTLRYLVEKNLVIRSGA